jgi:carbon storage regulator
MLVLTRRPGESIVIGDGIKLTVVTVGPGRVKIGVEAPSHVRIDREEVHTRIQQEQEQAADVLVSVKATAGGEPSDQNTMLNSGSSTEVLTNRIAGQLPSSLPATPPVSAPQPPVGSGISKYRLPRKPR